MHKPKENFPNCLQNPLYSYFGDYTQKYLVCVSFLDTMQSIFYFD